MVTETVEGRERYSVNVRYPRDFRNDPQAIAAQVLVNTADGASVPLGQVAKVGITQGPPSIRTENAQLVDYIYVDMQGRDLGGYVEAARKAVQDQVALPPVTISNGAASLNIWSGPQRGYRPSFP